MMNPLHRIDLERPFLDEPSPMDLDFRAIERLAARHVARRRGLLMGAAFAGVMVVAGGLLVAPRLVDPSSAAGPVGSTTSSAAAAEPVPGPDYRHVARLWVSGLQAGSTPEGALCLYTTGSTGGVMGLQFLAPVVRASDPDRIVDREGRQLALVGESFAVGGGLADITQTCDGMAMEVFLGQRD